MTSTRLYSCALCPAYIKHQKINFVREVKKFACDSHIEVLWKEAIKKKK